MDFPRIDAALEDCKNHLDAAGARNSSIENYLVSHLLIITISEYEQAIKAIVHARFLRAGDAHTASFARAAAGRLVRGPRVDEISTLLRYFHQSCKDAFQTACQGGTAMTSYDLIASGRNDVAHTSGVMMTIADFERHYQDSKTLVAEFAKCSGLTPTEIAALSW